MEAVLRRTALVKSQAKRKARILDHKRLVRDRVQYRMQNSLLCKETTQSIRNARKARREDWELGPIAPWRAAAAYATVAGTIAANGGGDGAGGASSGAGPGTGASGMARDEFFGTFSARRLNPPKVPEKYRVEDWFIKEGDRCVVMEGREGVKGRIGVVKSVDKETEMVTLEGINMIDIRIPAAMQTPDLPSRIHTSEQPLPLSSLKLVYPLPDPHTGIPRDTILTTLVKRNTHFDPYANTQSWDRVLSPQNITIPWPTPADPMHTDEKSDTLRIQVEETTFLPTLLRPPMPTTVIDELRNRYGKFRERHDEEWVAMKEAEDEQARRMKLLAERMVPKGARNVARKHPSTSEGTFLKDRKALPKMKESVMEALGRHMAKRQLERVQSQLEREGYVETSV